MIEFNGYLTGTSQKCFCNQFIKLLQKFIIFTFIPALVILSIVFYLLFDIVIVYPEVIISEIILVALAVMLPKVLIKKEKIIPKRVYIDNDVIVSESNSSAESRFIETVKEVRDYGEYYELIFVGYSIPFICQKNLLTQGSIDEFEALFAEKIKRM